MVVPTKKGHAAKVGYYAKIDPSQFWRENFRYGFHLHIPNTTYPHVKHLLGDDFASKHQDAPLTEVDQNTILIPYLQETDCVMPASLIIKDLLEGHKHVEDRGRTGQTHTVSGTSGYMAAVRHPTNRYEDFYQKIQGAVAPFTDLETQVLTEKGKRSGYGWFHRFLRLIETYWTIKREGDPAWAATCKVIWINERDDQVWVIAPTSFRWRRGLPKNKFTYEWSISFEVLYEYGMDTMYSNDLLSELDPQTELTAALTNINLGLDALKKISNRSNDFVRSHIRDLTALGGKVASVLDTGSALVAARADTLNAVVVQIIGLGERFGNSIGNATSPSDSLVVDAFSEAFISIQGAAVRAVNAYRYQESNSMEARTYESDVRMRGLSAVAGSRYGQGRQYINGLLSESSALTGELTEESNIGASPYGTGLSPTYNSFVSVPDPITTTRYQSYAMDYVQRGETIFDLARRLLGDRLKWHDLVLANDLAPPYIVQRTSDTSYLGTVLKPGDPIQVPSTATTGSDIQESESTLFAGRLPQTSGFASPLSSTVLRIYDPNRTGDREWTEDQWVNARVSILSGTGATETARVRRNDADTIYFSLEARLRYAVTGGDQTVTVEPGDLVNWPTSGRVVFDYFGTPETAYIASVSGNTITFEDALTNSYPKGAKLHQVDEVLTTTPDSTTQYLVWFDIERDQQNRRTPDARMGVDFRIVINEDNQIEMAVGPTGDVDLVTGEEAYMQSILLGMLTPVGANPLLPRDGVSSIIGKRATLDVITQYMMYIRRMVLADPRTEAILGEEITVGEDGNILGVLLDLKAVGGLETTVSTEPRSLVYADNPYLLPAP